MDGLFWYNRGQSIPLYKVFTCGRNLSLVSCEHPSMDAQDMAASMRPAR